MAEAVGVSFEVTWQRPVLGTEAHRVEATVPAMDGLCDGI